jgi:hypothetical protein
MPPCYRFRRRVGLRGPLPDARSRRRSTAHPRPAARGPKRAEVDRADRLCLALHATRLAALGGVLAADEAMATGGRLRGSGPRFARTIAAFGRQNVRTDGRHPRLSHPTLQPGERLPGRLGRSEAKEGLEDTRGGGHFGTPLLALFVTPAAGYRSLGAAQRRGSSRTARLVRFEIASRDAFHAESHATIPPEA